LAGSFDQRARQQHALASPRPPPARTAASTLATPKAISLGAFALRVVFFSCLGTGRTYRRAARRRRANWPARRGVGRACGGSNSRGVGPRDLAMVWPPASENRRKSWCRSLGVGSLGFSACAPSLAPQRPSSSRREARKAAAPKSQRRALLPGEFGVSAAADLSAARQQRLVARQGSSGPARDTGARTRLSSGPARRLLRVEDSGSN